MRAVPQVLLVVIPVTTALGVLAFWSRHEPNPPSSAHTAPRAQSAASPVTEVLPPALAAQPAPNTSASSASLHIASAAPQLSADSVASEMHALEDSNPSRALVLARQGQSQWPDGPRAAEFAATEVKCLYRLGNPSAGRGAAETMVNKYVGSPWAIEVERQTGAHAYVNH
jgi:hypothetical protein